MIKTTFIFSLKRIGFICIAILLIWLLRDYPQWRAQQKQQTSSKILDEIETTKEDSTANTEKEQQQHNDENNKSSIENLSLVHYILVTPFAALYIVGRAIIDTIRFSMYYIIWSCEKLIPYIDDWLFEKVTVWIPKKYNQTEQWWIEKGHPGFVLYKNQFQQQTFPAIIDNMETFFTKSYQVGCVIQISVQDFMAAWKRFTERHDWQQLAIDLGNIAYTVFWNPTVWIVTRSIRLGELVYRGLCSTIISIQNDVIWICTLLIPTTYNYIISTRLVKLSYHGIVELTKGIHWVCHGINDYILAPTLGRLLTWLIKSIDQLILLLQTRTIQERLHRIYRWIAPNLVWTIFEFSSMVIEIVTWAHLVFNQLIYPAFNLFMKYVVPRLAIAYQMIIVQWYKLYVYPAWLKICPYLNIPLLWAYTKVTAPVLRGLYTLVASISHYVTNHQWQVVSNKVIKFSMAYIQWVYGSIQLWLMKQAPILFNVIEKLYDLMINSCDWNELRQDSWDMVTLLRNLISKQSDMIYLSLERSLSNWAKGQQEYSGKNDNL